MMDFGTNFSYLSDLMVLSGGGNVRHRLEEKHMHTLVEALRTQLHRLENSEVIRTPTKDELVYGAKALILLQKLWERKQEKDAKRNFKRVIELTGIKSAKKNKRR